MKILIADDHKLFLKGLEFILKDLDDNISLTLAHSYTDIFQILENNQDFDLILSDLAMPGATWNDGIKHIQENAPHIPIIIISAVFDKKIIDKTLEIGVSGYIQKSSSNEEIKNAISMVLSGGIYIPNALIDEDIENLLSISDHNSSNNNEDDNILTPRQLEVINLIAIGYSNKQIAHDMGISEGTVKIYITELFKRLNVFNRTSAIVEATKKGLIKENNI